MTISPEKLAELLDRHWGPLLVWVGPCDGGAEDVIQQSFIALCSEPVVPQNPVAWLYKTSRNLAINAQKQRQRLQRRQAVAARPEEQPCTVWRTSEAAEIAEKLSRLPDEAREIVVAHLWGELSFEQIAKVVGKPRTTVWRHYNAALQSLRNMYGVPCAMKK